MLAWCVILVFIAVWIVWMYNNLFICLIKDSTEMGIFMHIFYGKYVQVSLGHIFKIIVAESQIAYLNISRFWQVVF